jgi:CPA1 family monovalent cation:H+ antiporter
MNYESVILILFVIASIVAMATRRLNLPYTIALMAVGLVLGSLHLLNPPHLTQELLYAVFLPPLIFEAAIHIKFSDMQKDLLLITTLVIPGVILSTLVTAAVMIPVSVHFTQIDTITWPLGILFGAAVAATDPVAVVSIFQRLGVPRRLRLLIESESLLNDGTSIVVFILALHYIQGNIGSPEATLIDFFKIVGFGLLAGTIVGLLTSVAMSQIDDAMVTITLSTVAAYGAFLIADRLGVSGVMSTVAAGLVVGNRGFSQTLFPSIRISTETFWEYLAFAMNSLIFLLMGFAINLQMLWELWPIVLIAYISVLVARFFVVNFTWLLFYPTRLKIPYNWSVVLAWGGLRGALSMVLALSIPDSLGFKEVIVTLVFGVVLLSIFIQGLSMTPLMRALKLASPVSEIKSYELLKTKIALLQDTLEEIDHLQKRRMLHAKSAKSLKEEFAKELERLETKLDELEPDKEAMLTEEMLRTKRRILMEQKNTLLEMYQNGAISFDAYEELKSQIDAKLLELENMGI